MIFLETVLLKVPAASLGNGARPQVGKGFAIGSAALVSLALFGAYCVRADVEVVDILNPWTFTGLLYSRVSRPNVVAVGPTPS